MRRRKPEPTADAAAVHAEILRDLERRPPRASDKQAPPELPRRTSGSSPAPQSSPTPGSRSRSAPRPLAGDASRSTPAPASRSQSGAPNRPPAQDPSRSGPDPKRKRRPGAAPPARRQLDLHLLTVEQALAAIRLNAASWRQQQIEEVLLIVGRGRHSEGGVPRLRPAVEEFCRARTDLFVSVAEAPRDRGGAGALVVRLRPR
jgi:DNA-nicking Smr family endonuclease